MKLIILNTKYSIQILLVLFEFRQGHYFNFWFKLDITHMYITNIFTYLYKKEKKYLMKIKHIKLRAKFH